MPLAAGVQIGPYRIVSLLGAGGMGEVYRARDDRLKRDVAVKMILGEVALDPGRLKRFAEEARAVGGLNHPGILAVYDVGEHAGAPYIVTELLEGDTLRARLVDGRIPARKAVDLAVQVAQALAAAHEKGIVHRDLKPENLFLLRDGRVKVLDFGLAKALDREPDPGAEGEASTMAAPATRTGAVLGTSGYMSPEQVRGQAVDHRADIFSFGAVLYEMLAGRPAFPGASHVERGYAALREDPPPIAITDGLPPGVEQVVRRCLEKQPDERFQSARDLAFSLQSLSASTLSAAQAPLDAPARRAGRPWLRPAVAGLAAAALAAGGFVAGRALAPRGPSATVPATYQRLTFRRGATRTARFSPDGRTVLLSTSYEDGPPRIYLLTPGKSEGRAITRQGTRLYGVSADGELAIGDGKNNLARVSLAGGAPRELLAGVVGADWSPDGQNLAIVRIVEDGHKLEYPSGHALYRTHGTIDSVRVSPDGQLVAFLDHPLRGDDRGTVAVVDKNGNRRAVGPAWYSVQGLAWRHDGKELWTTASPVGARSLHALGLDGADRVIAGFPGDCTLLDLAADGSALLRRSTSYTRIVAKPPGEERERDLAVFEDDLLVDMTPDGAYVLLVNGGVAAGAEYQVYLRPTDGKPAVNVAAGQGWALSADAKWVLVSPHAPYRELVLVPTGAGEAQPQPAGPIVEYGGAVFTPDARRFVVMGREEGKPWRLWVQTAGEPPRPIGEDGMTLARSAGVSPDGGRVAAVARDGVPVVVPLDQGTYVALEGLQPGDILFAFTQDGKGFYVVHPSDNGVWLGSYDAETHKITRLRDAPVSSQGGNAGAAFMARDGKSYAFSTQVNGSDVYLVRGLR